MHSLLVFLLAAAAVREALSATSAERSRSTVVAAFEVQPELEQPCPAQATPVERLARLEQLARAGRARHLARLFEVAGPEPAARSAWGVRRIDAVHRALVAILRRDGRSVGILVQESPRVPEDLRAVLVQASREGLGSRVVELCPIWLAAGGAYERAVLANIPRLDISVLAHQRAALADLVRPRLLAADPVLRELACMAVGQLRDDDALPRLLELFEDPEPGVARKAAWALVRLADADHGGSAAAWREWYAAQERLARERVPALLEVMLTADEAQAFEALAELAHCRLGRHAVARALASELWHPSQHIAARTAETLAELASPDVVPDLVHSLERPELLVQSAAWRALCEITDLELALEAKAWRDQLLR